MPAPLDIERLKTDPAYRAERATLRDGTRKPIVTREPVEAPQPIVNAHMSPADRAHWDLMNDWFQRSFDAAFANHFNAHVEPVIQAAAEAIGENHLDTLIVARMLNSILGINKNSLRPDVTLKDVQDNLKRLKEEIGVKVIIGDADGEDDEAINDAS